MEYIYNLGCNDLKVIIPIPIQIMSEFDDPVACWRSANIGMSGYNKEDAINGLKSCIESAFRMLYDYPYEKLGPAMRKQKVELIDHVEYVKDFE